MSGVDKEGTNALCAVVVNDVYINIARSKAHDERMDALGNSLHSYHNRLIVNPVTPQFEPISVHIKEILDRAGEYSIH